MGAMKEWQMELIETEDRWRIIADQMTGSELADDLTELLQFLKSAKYGADDRIKEVNLKMLGQKIDAMHSGALGI